jgi:hypothetical protein
MNKSLREKIRKLLFDGDCSNCDFIIDKILALFPTPLTEADFPKKKEHNQNNSTTEKHIIIGYNHCVDDCQALIAKYATPTFSGEDNLSTIMPSGEPIPPEKEHCKHYAESVCVSCAAENKEEQGEKVYTQLEMNEACRIRDLQIMKLTNKLAENEK